MRIALHRLSLAILLATSSLNTNAVEPERQTALKYLLVQDCGSCHGMTLKGGLGPALLPENLAGKPDELLINTILEGRTGTAMPPWRGLLTEAEAVWLVEQLRSGL